MEQEVEIVNSIYEGCLTKWADNIYSVTLPDTDIKFRMSFNGYPSAIPIIYDAGEWQEQFDSILQDVFIADEESIFSFLSEAKQAAESAPPRTSPAQFQPEASLAVKGSAHIADWVESEPIKDRNSVFEGRCIAVTTQKEALAYIADLELDKRISKATHNIYAWRLVNGDLVDRDCNDDGETAAGSRVLHLLDLTKVQNVVVVVSRWYGGTQLGPARFKHINACARDALERGGFLKDS